MNKQIFDKVIIKIERKPVSSLRGVNDDDIQYLKREGKIWHDGYLYNYRWQFVDRVKESKDGDFWFPWWWCCGLKENELLSLIGSKNMKKFRKGKMIFTIRVRVDFKHVVGRKRQFSHSCNR